jgi:hypothetical protein
MHTVQSAKGEPRATTLRDARKLGLLPSVTNILGVIAKPELTAWLQEQAVLAALTLPRIAGEGEAEFAQRVVVDAQSEREKAASFGTALHEGAARVAQTLEVDPEDPVAPWLRLYRDWYQANCVRLVWAERSLASPPLGFAGTADLLMEHQAHGLTLVDLKTQGVKPGMKATAYKSWCYQLAAYRAALGQPVACLNLIINSREPAEPVEHRWSEEDIQRGWLAFQSAQTLWSIEKNFDPRQHGTKSAESALAA